MFVTMKHLILLILLLLPITVNTQDIIDPRVGNNIQRDSNGRIIRDQKVLRDFVKLYPCPSTGKHTVSCPGFAIDHVIPLSCGGSDSIINLQWLPNDIKSCNKPYCKDRWERRVYNTNKFKKYC